MRNEDFYHNDFVQTGTDYASPEEVACYDERMRRFRDVESENRLVSELLELKPTDRILEIGSGTGAFSRFAATRCTEVVGVDISEVMNIYAARRADEERLENVFFRRGSFLSFDFQPGSFDGVVSSLALHHLSDVWKHVALERVAAVLKPGGILVLADVVFCPRAEENLLDYFARIVRLAPGSRSNFARHIADEFSTENWIMEGLLERAGFTIAADICQNDFMHFYKCVKNPQKE